MRSGGQSVPAATPTPYQKMMTGYMKSAGTATTANAVAAGVQAVSDMASSIMQYDAQMFALESQSRMAEKSWNAAKDGIESEEDLLDDVKTIHEHKIELGGKLARSAKDRTIAEARLLEAKKMKKSMKSANKAISNKLKSSRGRRSRFYGKTA